MVDEEKPIYTISQNGIAEINLFGQIGDYWSAVRGEEFANTIKNLALQKYGEVKRINVRINSPGGSVMHAYTIFSAIQSINQNNTEYKGCWVDTYIDGMAFSAAGWIALAGKKVFMNDYARFMIHNPYTTNPDSSLETKNFTENIRESILDVFVSKTKKTREELSVMMSTTTFLTAKQCLDYGFINEIIPTSKEQKNQFQNYLNSFEIIQNAFKTPEENNQTNFNKTQTPNKPMQLLAKALNLAENASEAEMVEAVNKLRAYEMVNSTYKDKIAVLEAENKLFAENLKQIEKTKIENLVQGFVKDGTIKETERENWTKIAENNFELAENTLKSIKTSVSVQAHPKLSAMVNNKGTEMKFSDFLNNPKELQELKENDLDTYKSLYKNHYGFDYK